MTELRIGVDVGGTKVAAVRVVVTPDGDVEVEATARVETPGPAGLVEAIAGVVRDLEPDGRAPVGVGLPGLVDGQGRLVFAPNLGGAVDLPVAEALRVLRPGPVEVDNDANCAALAEQRIGAGAGHDDVLVVTVGTGIGGGVVTGGTLLRGARGYAGEIGHLTVERGGAPCGCGRSGCWERYASGEGLGRLAREAAARGGLVDVVASAGGVEQVSGHHVTSAARRGDPEAAALLLELGEWLGIGIGGLVDVLDPAVVVLGGGLAAEADLFIDRTREVLDRRLLGSGHRDRVEVLVATLGPSAGAIGAALLGP